MFSSSYRPADAYKQAGVELDVKTADPHQLVTIIFEATDVALKRARQALVERDIPTKGSMLSKAIDLIDNGLRASLDLNQGDTLAERLYALYEYMVARLLHAHSQNDLSAIDEVIGLLGEISSAWKEIRPQVTQNRALSAE